MSGSAGAQGLLLQCKKSAAYWADISDNSGTLWWELLAGTYASIYFVSWIVFRELHVVNAFVWSCAQCMSCHYCTCKLCCPYTTTELTDLSGSTMDISNWTCLRRSWWLLPEWRHHAAYRSNYKAAKYAKQCVHIFWTIPPWSSSSLRQQPSSSTPTFVCMQLWRMKNVLKEVCDCALS